VAAPFYIPIRNAEAYFPTSLETVVIAILLDERAAHYGFDLYF
jgi:hypothetical protein